MPLFGKSRKSKAEKENDDEPRLGPWIGVLVAIALLGVVVVIGSGRQAATSMGSGPEPAPGAVGKPRTQACSSRGGDGPVRALQEAPKSTSWALVGTMAAPSSRAAGPTTVDTQGYARCFARTGEGALYAATHFWASGTSDRLSGTRALKAWLLPGPDRERELADPANEGRFDSEYRLQVRAFRFDPAPVAGDVAISIAFGVEGTPKYVEAMTTLRWTDGDWRMVAPREGQPSAQMLDSLISFVGWSGA